eukprot:341933-Heterocapsa_arctica.AAC.1
MGSHPKLPRCSLRVIRERASELRPCAKCSLEVSRDTLFNAARDRGTSLGGSQRKSHQKTAANFCANFPHQFLFATLSTNNL